VIDYYLGDVRAWRWMYGVDGHLFTSGHQAPAPRNWPRKGASDVHPTVLEATFKEAMGSQDSR
jgi:hypothetical protein